MPVNDRVNPPSGSVRLITSEGENIGVVPVHEALDRAKQSKLDLVQITSVPKEADLARDFVPVCKILDHKLMKEVAQKKDYAARSKQRQNRSTTTVKEVKVGTSIGDHDLEFKLKRAHQFLEKKHIVRFTLVFRRSMALKPSERAARGFEVLRLAGERLAEVGREEVEQRKVMKGSIRAVFLPGKAPTPSS
eukprot:CAMPEP_0184511278 /NCGR_PEP_ID=MMETSP0198_2-20121128/2265_1 /TAXON_ID=1112570 /ORGANISM="Thraustochytrium sp., Strain LLF1b" /LENGTH=190 /DNA_ID=CAMNT_0026901231 /DNA_START=126 /DNA_END=698 /DNA_ORIENTATION=-